MKIKHKLMLAMIGLPLVVFLGYGIMSLNITYQELITDKRELYSESAAQALRSFESVSDEMEVSFFNLCKAEGVANTLVLEKSTLQKQAQLRLKLDNIITGLANYVQDGFIVDLEDHFYFSSDTSSEVRTQYEKLIGEYPPEQDVQWCMDGQGNVYLYRAIYTLAPYIRQGTLVCKVNTGHLAALAGMNGRDGSEYCVMLKNTKPLFSSSETGIPSDTLQQCAALTENVDKDWVTAEIAGEKFESYRIAGGRGEWGMIFQVRHYTMMARYYSILRNMMWGSIALFVFSVLLALLISRGLTRNITELITSVRKIRKSPLNKPLNDLIEVKGKDEVAQLATQFNALLAYINSTHQTEYEMLDLKYRFIQSQISPHFISNVLSSITSYSFMGDSEKMEELCVRTSHYLKNNLHIGEKRFITISREIENVLEYVNIFRLVSAQDVCFEVDCPDELKNESILSMLLQPLVENALLHATSGSRQSYVMGIAFVMRQNMIRVEVFDNGCGIPTEAMKQMEAFRKDPLNSEIPAGFGIGAVIRRLRLQYENDYSFDVNTVTGTGTRVIISYPARSSQSA